MNLATMRSGVYARLGIKESDPQFPGPVINIFINAAIRQYAAARLWPWLDTVETITTAGGTDTYTPGANGTGTWVSTDDLVLTADDGIVFTLNRHDRSVLDDWTVTERARPEVFAVSADQIVLRPIPDRAYTLTHRYQRAEKVLVSDTDVPYLPDAYADAVVDLATVLALGRSKEDNRAVAAAARYSQWLDMMDDNRRRGRKPSRVRVRPGGWL